MLHPCHKLLYFKAAKWEEDWIDTAEAFIHKTFMHLYATANSTSSNLDLEHAQDINKGSRNKKCVCLDYNIRY